MYDFTDIITKINSDKRLVPDLMKSEKGNNFRAISESAILDVIDPVLHECGWFYTIEIKKSDLQIKEAYGSKGKKLQFIATVEIKVLFWRNGETTYNPLNPLTRPYTHEVIATEAVGMGIDDNDKAMGKAYTYALKYALLKVFRLRYGDDPDFKASEPLLVDKPKKEEAAKDEKKSHTTKKAASEPLMTEKQRDYIIGMMDKKGVEPITILRKFSYDPKTEEKIPMKIAREIIKWLENDDDLPF